MNQRQLPQEPARPRTYQFCVSSDERQAIEPGPSGPFHLTGSNGYPELQGIVFLLGEITEERYREESDEPDARLGLLYALARHFHPNNNYESPMLVLRANHGYIYTRELETDDPDPDAVQTRCLQFLSDDPVEQTPAGAAAAAIPMVEIALPAADFLMEVAERQYRYNNGVLTPELVRETAMEQGITAADLRRPANP